MEKNIEKVLSNIKELLPVSVGDWVYFSKVDIMDRAAQIDYIRIEKNKIYFGWCQYDYGPDITELWDDGEFSLEDFGKTVFKTEEEALAKLKETNPSAYKYIMEGSMDE